MGLSVRNKDQVCLSYRSVHINSEHLTSSKEVCELGLRGRAQSSQLALCRRTQILKLSHDFVKEVGH